MLLRGKATALESLHAMKVHIRPAVAADIPILGLLIDASVRGLQAGDYTPAQIEASLRTVYGVDSQLIADGTYFVAEAEVPGEAPARLLLPAAAAGASAKRSSAETTGLIARMICSTRQRMPLRFGHSSSIPLGRGGESAA